MKLLFLLVLLSSSLALDLDLEPRKQNLVTRFLGEILDQFFQKLSTEGVSIPLLDLEKVGNFSSVEVTASGLTQYLNGIQSYGFQLNVNASEAAVCGKYHLVNLDVPGLFPIFGKGDFCVEMEAINVKMTLRASRDFVTEKFDFDLTEFGVQVASSKVKFENLMDDPHVADFLNELLSNLLPDLVPVVAEWLKTNERGLPAMIDKYGNGIFDCLKEGQKDAILKCIKDLFAKSKLLSYSDHLFSFPLFFPSEMDQKAEEIYKSDSTD